ncbi:MAG: nitrophenyl compound nitroreductase subunit ArsF family protein [Pseudomonadota bacterium]
MKTHKLKIMTLFCLLLACPCVIAADNAAAKKAPAAQPTSFITAYYFHGNYRCVTCRKMEQYSREAIELYFSAQLKSGAVVFQPINYEESGNDHFVQDYQLITRSLVLVKYENGKQAAWKNLPAIWQHAGDQTAFYNYVKKEIEAYL